ncbi:hypothetical protein [Nonlabens ponticola]|uniref:PorT family protein n=1 Tax=Nonlabens ponticola TaxID=2496866 RepID=A0A3S9N111_9FLAO|nr:hypothetical protein [Nonlabens ponticola]AZQ42706.1 hypothetical protein EJ995_00045 [Nonlabens ponticola]AZQ45097.1 hypothetical protein EJ995_12965 [Nonlabens ponticola]
MKKFFLSSICLLAFTLSYAQDDNDDDQDTQEVPSDFLDAFDSSREDRDVKTVTNGVFAVGWNQALGDDNGIGEDYRFWGSGIWELGLEFSTKVNKANTVRFNYGLSFQWQTLRINDNKEFETSGDVTRLQPVGFNVDKSKFEQLTIIAPVHLEFGKQDKITYDNGVTRYDDVESWTIGLGGYLGINAATNQLLKFENEGRDVTTRRYNDYEMEDFVYGLSAYVGNGALQIFAKYGLNSIFKDSPVDQQYASIGFRFR